MSAALEVLFAPAEFEALRRRSLVGSVGVVFDVLRATTSMVTALAHGAAGVIPVSEIAEALALRQQHPHLLLAGERQGLRIRAAQADGVDFDLGNSPREFGKAVVEGRMIAMTTTNGTRALQACAGAKETLVACWHNLASTARRLREVPPDALVVVGAGTFDEAAYEDTLAAGALCDLLWDRFDGREVADSAWMARELYLRAQPNLAEAMRQARNARRLLSRPELADDVAFCLRRDVVDLVATLGADGVVRGGPAGVAG